MDVELARQAQKLFKRTLDLDPAERDRFLEQAAEGNETLVAEVKALLAAFDEADSFLETSLLEKGSLGDLAGGGRVEVPAMPSTSPTTPPRQVTPDERVTDEDASPPTTHHPTPVPGEEERLGRFAIRRVIAAGDGVEICEAIQEEPHRTVAIKILRPGGSDAARRQLKYEAQTLARLRHAGIPEVHDAGSVETAGGLASYYAMEYIPGARSLNAYAEAHEMATADRLRLFVPICDAMHHAHQEGILHHDLRPGNLLVGTSGEPKITGFRVAAFDAASASPREGLAMQYLSPEQCELDPENLDARSDIYALGVVLYELLCGEPPYDVRECTAGEAASIIREQSAPRPRTTVRSLGHEVEVILRKSLEKDRARRYQTAEEMAGDIRRFLEGQPLAARTPSMPYSTSRWFGRHRVAAAAVLALAIVAIVLATVIGGLNTRLDVSREETRIARDEATGAVTAHRQTEAERDETKRQINTLREDLQWQSYATAIAAAHAALANGDDAGRRRRLTLTPESIRGWEWGYLNGVEILPKAAATSASPEALQPVISKATLSRDGSRLAAADGERGVVVWDLAEGRELWALDRPGRDLGCVMLSVDGRRLVYAEESSITFVDVETGDTRHRILTGDSQVLCVDSHPREARMVTGSSDGSVRLWTMHADQSPAVSATWATHEAAVRDVRFSPDGRLIASASDDGRVRILAAADGSSRVQARHTGEVLSLAWSPDGTILASGARDRTIRCWNTDNGRSIAVLRGHESDVHSLAYSPDGSRLASGDATRTVKLWDTQRHEEILTLRTPGPEVLSVAFTPDGRRLLSHVAGGKPVFWESR